jgi:hypothetical protein
MSNPRFAALKFYDVNQQKQTKLHEDQQKKPRQWFGPNVAQPQACHFISPVVPLYDPASIGNTYASRSGSSRSAGATGLP